jgi:hypothetical protein
LTDIDLIKAGMQYGNAWRRKNERRRGGRLWLDRTKEGAKSVLATLCRLPTLRPRISWSSFIGSGVMVCRRVMQCRAQLKLMYGKYLRWAQKNR